MSFENTLKEWYVRDLQKTPVDKFDRATIIRSYLIDNKLSIRAFAERFGINRSTVEDWLLYDRISKEEYEEQLAKGIGYKELYKMLRRNKRDKQPLNYSDIDLFLTEMKPKIRHYRNKGDITPRTFQLIDELVNLLNNLSVELRIKEKNK